MKNKENKFDLENVWDSPGHGIPLPKNDIPACHFYRIFYLDVFWLKK